MINYAYFCWVLCWLLIEKNKGVYGKYFTKKERKECKMKKWKNKLFFIFMMLGFGLIGGMKNVYAETATLTSTDIEEDVKYIFYWERSDGYVANGWMKNFAIKDSGSEEFKVAYCIEPGIAETTEPDGYTKTTWENIGLSDEVKQEILLTAYYGYQYPGHQTQEYRSATQALLWKAILNDEESNSNYTWDVSYKKKYYDENLQKDVYEVWDLSTEREIISNLVKHHNDTPSFDGESFSAQIGEEIVITDTKGVLQNYDVYEKNGAKVEIVGNQLKITPTKAGTIELKFERKQVYGESYFVYYGEFSDGESAQNMITGGNVDPVYFSINLTGTVPLKVVKIDSSTKEVITRANIKFKICKVDTDYCITHTVDDVETDIFSTDSNGIFVTEGLENGKYYLLEVDQVVDGYVWNEKSLEFEIGENSELINDENYGIVYQINFENCPVKGNVELVKTGEKVDFVDNEFVYSDIKLAGVKFGLYAKEDIYNSNNKLVYAKDTLIGEYITDSDGLLSIKDLYLGSYYILELETDIHHLLDTTKHEFELVYKDQYTENITINKEIKNYLSKGTLDFTKRDFSTSEALPNTVIEIYTNEEFPQLVYTGKTDEFGSIIISELPVGKYYIIEKEAPFGYELNPEKMYFEITYNGEIVKATMLDKRKEEAKKDENKIVQIANVPNTGLSDVNFNLFGILTIALVGLGLIVYGIKENTETP